MRDPKRDLSERARVLDLLGKAGADVSFLTARLDADMDLAIRELERIAPEDPEVRALRVRFETMTRGGIA